MTEEFSDIQHLVFESVNYLMRFAGSMDKISIQKFEMPPEQEIKYGLRKYILVATQLNTIVAIDTKFHTTLWKYTLIYA